MIRILPRLREDNEDAKVKLSHFLRRSQDASSEPILSAETAESLLKRPLPRPREQADLLLRWLAQHHPTPGEEIWIDAELHGAVVGAKTHQGLALVVGHLFEQRLLLGTSTQDLGTPRTTRVTLSFTGWDRYEELRRGGGVYRKAFMAMKYGEAQLDTLLDTVFKPSARQAGFDLLRLDDVPRAGLIDDRLRVEIQTSDFVVADLSHDNLGAYWEAGYAEGLGKPVIYTCEKSKFEKAKTHFDTNHHLTIEWDVENLSSAGKALKATIRATLPHIATQSDDES